MGILRSIFGPSRKLIWKQMARELGAEYDERGMFHADVVRYEDRASRPRAGRLVALSDPLFRAGS